MDNEGMETVPNNSYIDIGLLSLIRKEIDIHISDFTMTKYDLATFKDFSDAFDIINAYEEGYYDGEYEEYLKIIYRELKK